MSASREKRMRKSTEPKAVAKQEPVKKTMPAALKWAIGVVAALVLLALVGVSLFVNSDYYYKNTTALTVGEHELTPADFNYYYRETYYKMSQESGDMGDYMSYLTALITEDAVRTAKETYAIYDTAVAEGYALTEEEIADLDQEIEDMAATAKSMGAANTDQMLESVYGRGCDTESYRKYREVNTLVSRYTTDVTESQDVSDAALEEYYAEHVEEMDTVTYRQFYLPIQETMEDTQTLAQTILAEAKENEIAMDEYALEYASEDTVEHYSTENATLLKGIGKASATAEVADWLFDTARTEGDTASIENEDGTGLYLVRFGSRDSGDYNTVNVRHILVSANTADEEAKKTAQETAQSYLDEFQNGDKTEDSFAALAQEYSDDNADEGGLYEGIYKGQMVSAFEDWCFDASRQPGDSGIVETEYGYHIMYFVGEGESFRNVKAKTEILNDFYATWIEELTADYPVTRDEEGMSYVTTSASY